MESMSDDPADEAAEQELLRTMAGKCDAMLAMTQETHAGVDRINATMDRIDGTIDRIEAGFDQTEASLDRSIATMDRIRELIGRIGQEP
jgi:methyl-accepting chemotaxis protein